jgi:hypothetical protein
LLHFSEYKEILKTIMVSPLSTVQYLPYIFPCTSLSFQLPEIYLNLPFTFSGGGGVGKSCLTVRMLQNTYMVIMCSIFIMDELTVFFNTRSLNYSTFYWAFQKECHTKFFPYLLPVLYCTRTYIVKIKKWNRANIIIMGNWLVTRTFSQKIATLKIFIEN